MLGWKIYITKESDADNSKSLVSWCTGIGGLDWLDQLVKDGLAQDLGDEGQNYIDGNFVLEKDFYSVASWQIDLPL